MRFAHIADIHFRGLQRHAEYRAVFEEFFEECRRRDVDHIVVVGDIWHTKTQGITPEAIDIMSWFFREGASVAPMAVTLGNHDMNVTNRSRQDAISPIINAIQESNVTLYKESGVYRIADGFNLCVFSCWDEKTGIWKDVNAVQSDINIALFHGSVLGATTDDGWKLDADLPLEAFNEFDFVFLGDIHKHQFLDKEQRIAYPGSTIPQNFGEHGAKGCLFWDIRSRDDFDVEFHPLKSSRPFVTIDWQGTVPETIDIAKRYPKGTRFRIRNHMRLSQVDVGQLENELKLQCEADRVVFKIDPPTDHATLCENTLASPQLDLRDLDTQMRLLRDFLESADLTEEEWSSIEKRTERYLSLATKGETTARNVRWDLKRLEFDNTFCYGEGNVLDFSRLTGITGIFAPNRSGKSSIIGSVMYALFNTTDRGSIKNLHIINTRKNECKTRALVAIDGDDHVIERVSTKYMIKKTGYEHAVTALDFYVTDGAGNNVKSLNGEQRSVTDAALRRMIGTAEDFSLTSLARQGFTNSLISEGSAYRMSTLARFLGADIYEMMLRHMREDRDGLRDDMKNYTDRDWDALISELDAKKITAEHNVVELRARIARWRNDLDKAKIDVAKLESIDAVPTEKIDEQESKIASMCVEKECKEEEHKTASGVIQKLKGQLDAVIKKRDKMNVAELADGMRAQQEAEKTVASLKHHYRHENTLLAGQKKSLNILKEVPCGDQFPTCQFIKDSHENKKKIPAREKDVARLLQKIEDASRVLSDALAEQYEHKLHEHKRLDELAGKLQVQLQSREISRDRLKMEAERLNTDLSRERTHLKSLKKRVMNSTQSRKILEGKTRIRELNELIERSDQKLITQNGNVMVWEREIERLAAERDEYTKKRREWYVFEKLMTAFSKNGIPAQIINSRLPLINAEVASILHSSTDFTLVFEADNESNAMDIYIDYGDSRRLIELCSGMEKVISSLAIRVALINISSLPKTNVFIIDEGFGALDELQLEVCGRFMQSLKKHFRNILIISHVPDVKDMVDNLLEITRHNKDAKIVHEAERFHDV